MRKFLILISILMNLSLKAQLKEGLNRFENVHIIKNKYEIIVITRDTIIVDKLSKMNISYDSYPCKDNNGKESIMFNFLKRDEILILENIFTDKNIILVEK